MPDLEYVVCFDRDETVSVNPAPDREAVPLSWVKELAHGRDDVDVWATGNQHLRAEAAIYGIDEARDLWESYNERSVKPEYESRGYHSYKPARMEGLRLIEDVYDAYAESMPTMVVVDDVDLRGLEGFFHYFPWDFVEAVQADDAVVEIDTDTAFCDEPAQGSACDCDVEHGVLIK